MEKVKITTKLKNNIKKVKRNLALLTTFVATNIYLMFSSTSAFATSGPGQSAGTWAQTQAKGLYTAIVAILLIVAIAKRAFGYLALILVIGMVAGLFIWNPTLLQSTGTKWLKDLLGI